MFNTYLLSIALALSAFAGESGAKLSATIQLDRGTHRAEVATGANFAEPLLGDRGCAARSQSTCQDFERVTELVAGVAKGDRLLPLIDGEGVADRITFSRNGVELFSQDKVGLPFEIAGRFEVEEGDVFQLAVRQGDAFAVSTVKTNDRAASTTIYDFEITLDIRFFVPHNGALAEVVTNSGTGGRFYSRSPFCARPNTPLSSCPANRVVRFYTDRASRGETIFTLLDKPSQPGVAVAYIVVDNAIRVGPLYVPVPQADLIRQTVSTNVNDDNIVIYAYYQTWWNSQRVPIGTRP